MAQHAIRSGESFTLAGSAGCGVGMDAEKHVPTARGADGFRGILIWIVCLLRLDSFTSKVSAIPSGSGGKAFFSGFDSGCCSSFTF
jgi:hypothetical protein